MYRVYAIKSIKKNYIYVGLTKDIKSSLKRHNSGYEKTTRSYKPFLVIHEERFETRQLAREREKYLKSGVGKEFLKKLTNKKPEW